MFALDEWTLIQQRNAVALEANSLNRRRKLCHFVVGTGVDRIDREDFAIVRVRQERAVLANVIQRPAACCSGTRSSAKCSSAKSRYARKVSSHWPGKCPERKSISRRLPRPAVVDCLVRREQRIPPNRRSVVEQLCRRPPCFLNGIAEAFVGNELIDEVGAMSAGVVPQTAPAAARSEPEDARLLDTLPSSGRPTFCQPSSRPGLRWCRACHRLPPV